MRNLFSDIRDIVVEALNGQLLSLMVIGGGVKGLDAHKWTQDVDFVAVIRNKCNACSFELLRNGLDTYCFSNTTSDLVVNWHCEDGPWKPNAMDTRSVSIHIALLDESAFHHRLAKERNLAVSMYQDCLMLVGERPLEPNIPVLRNEMVESWSGLSWILSDILTTTVLEADAVVRRQHIAKMIKRFDDYGVGSEEACISENVQPFAQNDCGIPWADQACMEAQQRIDNFLSGDAV